ncbi:MarR family winged helix-turn-helix transcriptional regulator [Litoreibacter janthinus]|uniref:Transcriptional regulator, MarR family n=1 Tax=Litoreibacter janthinus TaxID=670154 RepID=A0A1I6FZW8_9RHOB|nr:MarR family winged helix-turn-helix transcriptional regulator [Litoreibacter janthinus]SFR35495.1 transcriptional regulator, MarR family [Litoreibacter janthinus]
MVDIQDPIAASLFSELFMVDQLARGKLGKALPKGMELSHFTMLNHLYQQTEPRTPAQLAKSFALTRGALTNTLSKLEWAGHIHVSPDWDDARRKQVVISPAGRRARNTALESITPMVMELIERVGSDRIRDALPVLRDLRRSLLED